MPVGPPPIQVQPRAKYQAFLADSRHGKFRRELAKAILLAIAFTGALLALAQARQIDCHPPFANPLQKAICSDNQRKWRERKLSDIFDMLATLLDGSGHNVLPAEQRTWEQQRLEACGPLAEREMAACLDRFTDGRLKKLETRLAQELDKTVGTIQVLGRELDIKRMTAQGDPRPSWMRLVYRDRTLAESVRPFEVLARHGNSRSEVVIVRGWSEKNSQILAIVGRAGGEPPEVWLDFGARESTQYAADEDGLLISDPDGLKIRWSPSEGWRTIARPSTAEKLQPPIEVAPAALANDAPTPEHAPEDKILFRLGGVEVIESRVTDKNSVGHPVLRAGGAFVMDGWTHFDVTGQDRIGDTEIAFVTRPDGGNGGCHSDFLFAATPGHPLRIWTEPNDGGCIMSGGLSRERTPDGYLLTMPARPSRDGVRYRWTPGEGLRVDGPVTFERPIRGTMADFLQRQRANSGYDSSHGAPLFNGEFYGAFERAAGPNLQRLAAYLDPSGTLLTWQDDNPEFVVFSECTAYRVCNAPRDAILAIYQVSTHQFYFAAGVGEGPCELSGINPPPSFQNLKRYPVEYHPPLEKWSLGAQEALWRWYCRPH